MTDLVRHHTDAAGSFWGTPIGYAVIAVPTSSAFLFVVRGFANLSSPVAIGLDVILMFILAWLLTNSPQQEGHEEQWRR